jgi:DNA-binding response OmpR family regulator
MCDEGKGVPVLLVVGNDHVGSGHVRTLEREFAVTRVPSPDAAWDRSRHERCEAVIVDRPLADPETVWFVWELRHDEVGRASVPIVAVSEEADPETDVDAVVDAPVDGKAVLTAVRRAVRVVEYEDAICQLFDACRRGFDRASSDLGTARERADECLRELDACDGRLPFERLIDA